MQARKLEIRCPLCSSADVSYSCTPSCCFNHVCADCFATFEPATQVAGGKAPRVEPPETPRDPADPAAPCAACGSAEVYQGETALVCLQCRTLLVLELTQVTPG